MIAAPRFDCGVVEDIRTAEASSPLASFLSSLRAEWPRVTDVRVVVDNAAMPSHRNQGGPSIRLCDDIIDRHSQRGENRWQTEPQSSSLLSSSTLSTTTTSHMMIEQPVQPLTRLGPTMPRRRRSFDESDERLCQTLRECCSIKDDDRHHRPMRMPQRVCSSDLTKAAIFPESKAQQQPPQLSPRSSWERTGRACPAG